MYDSDSGRSNSGPVPCLQGFPLKVQISGIFRAVGKDIYYCFSPGTDISSNFFAFSSFTCLVCYMIQVSLPMYIIFNYIYIRSCSEENIELCFSNRPISMHNISDVLWDKKVVAEYIETSSVESQFFSLQFPCKFNF